MAHSLSSRFVVIFIAPDKSGYPHNAFHIFPVIYLQFNTYASQDLLGLYKVNPTRKSLCPSQNFPLYFCKS